MSVGPSDAELANVLRGVLADREVGVPARIERRPSAYRTSFPIEELRVQLSGGGAVRLGFKRLDWEELEAGARLAKPRFLHDPQREPAVYRFLLPQAPAGPPLLYGSVLDGDRHWLFFEWIEGRELFQVGERELWEEAARWLARFHVAMAPELDRHREQGRLIEHDAAYLRRWIERAGEFAHRRGDGSAATVAWLSKRHERVVEALLALPRTVLHGEFYASNVLVASAPDSGHSRLGQISDTRVAPVDWELVAVGSGLSDLAALLSGWPAADRQALAAAYAAEPGVPPLTPRDLDLARLQVAIQWLGWAPPEWEPPPGQRHDWLGEATRLVEELGL
jgi:thiamine kinase-like enzyme